MEEPYQGGGSNAARAPEPKLSKVARNVRSKGKTLLNKLASKGKSVGGGLRKRSPA